MGTRARRAVSRLAAFGNQVAVGLYRLTGGRVVPKPPSAPPVLLLTVAGRTTGRTRTTPVCWFDLDGARVVVGSAGGAAREPQWFRNLRAASTAQVQVGRARQPVTVRVLHGEERDRVWRDVVLPRSRAFGDYERKAGRTMPVAVLTPA